MDHAEIHRAGLKEVGSALSEDLNERPVLVVRAPNLPEESRTSLRDYVVESLRLGVMVIWPGFSYSLERFPDLGGVCCHITEPSEVKMDPPVEREQLLREHKVFQPIINGHNAQEKMAILARLKAYRKSHGLGCLDEVARAAGGDFTADLLRRILLGDASLNIPQWRKLRKVLEQLEAEKEATNGQSD